MTEPDSPPEVDPYRVAHIVSSYVRHHQIGADQLAGLIATVHRALAGLGRAAPPLEEPLTPAVTIRRSVQPDYVVCLECGYHAQVLRGICGSPIISKSPITGLAGNCQLIIRSPRRPIRSGVRRWQSRSVLV